jgi:predicted alpha/beta-fold hydrolase
LQSRFPDDVPILAAGFSAGSSLVGCYLGSRGEKSLIDAAVLCSPGYDMQASFDTLHPLADAYVTKLAKDLWLADNHDVLQQACPQALQGLKGARTMAQWHEHLWALNGYECRDAYFRDHNPAYLLEAIAKPTLYLNSLDVSRGGGHATH